MFLNIFFQLLLRPRGKYSFIKKNKKKICLFDVGCGNNSPRKIKSINSKFFYVGLDIANYNNDASSLSYADEIITTEPNNFSSAILDLKVNPEMIISSHNLEHCLNPYEVLKNLSTVLKPNGVMYLSFPSEKTINFPSRDGCLNFYDDETHIHRPLELNKIKNILISNGLKIDFISEQYRPTILKFIGFLLEPFSYFMGKNLLGNWEFWGFETIIHVKKKC